MIGSGMGSGNVEAAEGLCPGLLTHERTGTTPMQARVPRALRLRCAQVLPEYGSGLRLSGGQHKHASGDAGVRDSLEPTSSGEVGELYVAKR